jgi:hypothetical protein
VHGRDIGKERRGIVGVVAANAAASRTGRSDHCASVLDLAVIAATSAVWRLRLTAAGQRDHQTRDQHGPLDVHRFDPPHSGSN